MSKNPPLKVNTSTKSIHNCCFPGLLYDFQANIFHFFREPGGKGQLSSIFERKEVRRLLVKGKKRDEVALKSVRGRERDEDA